MEKKIMHPVYSIHREQRPMIFDYRDVYKYKEATTEKLQFTLFLCLTFMLAPGYEPLILIAPLFILSYVRSYDEINGETNCTPRSHSPCHDKYYDRQQCTWSAQVVNDSSDNLADAAVQRDKALVQQRQDALDLIRYSLRYFST